MIYTTLISSDTKTKMTGFYTETVPQVNDYFVLTTPRSGLEPPEDIEYKVVKVEWSLDTHNIPKVRLHLRLP